MRFSIANLLWVMLVAAAFLLGFTVRTARDPLTPVLIASRNIDERQFLQDQDFRVVYHRASTLPFGVLTNPEQTSKQHAIRKIRCGQYVFPEDLSDFNGRICLPEGRSVVAVRLDISIHSLALHLFSQGDRVSLQFVSKDKDGNRIVENIARSAIIFSVNESPESGAAIVGLMVSDEQKQRIINAQANTPAGDFVFDRPLTAE